MSAVVLDSHVLHWWTVDSRRVSRSATEAISSADELHVSDITWWELAWLATHERISLTLPIASWLGQLATQVRTVPITPAIARPFDLRNRLGDRRQLVTKDERLRAYRAPRAVTIW